MVNLFLLILVIFALLALELKNLLSSVIVLGAFSLLLSLVLYYLHAPDVAVTEAAIGSAFATIIFIVAIKKQGILIMITFPHSRFFYYNQLGKPAGFDYDILSLFAQKLGVDLEVQEVQRWEELIPRLKAGKGDIIGAGMTYLVEREKEMSFSEGYFPTRVVLVSHLKNKELNTIADVREKTVFTVAGTSCYLALKTLSRVKIDTSITDPNALIKSVSEGKIDIVAVDYIEAIDGQIKYGNLKIIATISDIQNYAFGIAKNKEELLSELNDFLREIKQDGTYQKLYDKYFH